MSALSTSPSSPQHVTPERPGLIKRPREACIACRSLKTRCLPYGDGPLTSKDRCARCTKYGLVCEYQRKVRGKQKPPIDNSTPTGPTPTSSSSLSRTSMDAGRDGQMSQESLNHLHSEGSRGSFGGYSQERFSGSSASGSTMSIPRGPGKTEIWAPPAPDINNPYPNNQYSDSFARAAPLPQAPLPPAPYAQPRAFTSYPHPPPHNPSDAPPQPPQVQEYHHPPQLPPMLPPASTHHNDRPMAQMPHDGMPPSNDMGGVFRGPPVGQHVQLPPIEFRPPAVPLASRASQSSTPSYSSSERRRRQEASSNVADYIAPRLGHEGSRSPSPRMDGTAMIPGGGAPGPIADTNGRPPGSQQMSGQQMVNTMKLGGRLSSLSPIELGMVSEHEAKYLYDLFAKNLCPILAGMDIVYLTYERMRSSDTLFTAMLYASARFHHPEICRGLYAHANMLVNRITTHGVLDVACIQALIILAYWSLPGDRSAYLKSGLALRAATQLRLWKRAERPLPEDQDAARAILNSERTWIALLILDVGFSKLFNQPLLLPGPGYGFDDIHEWAMEHEYLNIPNDHYLAWHANQSRGSSALPMNRVEDGDEDHYPDELTQPENLLMAMLNKALPHLSPIYSQMATIVTTIMILHIRSIALIHGPNEHSKRSLIDTAELLTGQFEQMAAGGQLVFWSDCVMAGVSLPGVLFYKARQAFAPHEWDRIIAVLNRMMAMCGQMLGAHNDHPLYLTYRFYFRLLPVLDGIKQGMQEPQIPQHQEMMAYPNPMELLGMPDPSQMYSSATFTGVDMSGFFPEPSVVQNDELWNFLTGGPNSDMGIIFNAAQG
ncbi:hypothetical protein IAT38_006979 [Cryptococcus sp. DSM 104549]